MTQTGQHRRRENTLARGHTVDLVRDPGRGQGGPNERSDAEGLPRAIRTTVKTTIEVWSMANSKHLAMVLDRIELGRQYTIMVMVSPRAMCSVLGVVSDISKIGVPMMNAAILIAGTIPPPSRSHGRSGSWPQAYRRPGSWLEDHAGSNLYSLIWSSTYLCMASRSRSRTTFRAPNRDQEQMLARKIFNLMDNRSWSVSDTGIKYDSHIWWGE